MIADFSQNIKKEKKNGMQLLKIFLKVILTLFEYLM